MVILLSLNGSLVPFPPRIDSARSSGCGDKVSGELLVNP
jgi:hypothetical protein